MRWIAFFSHTGSLIVLLSKILNKQPDVVIHHNYKKSSPVSELSNFNIILFPYNPSILLYTNVLQEGDLITLHGYMRIIPDLICNQYEIYNLHPAPIHRYKTLRGKDPVDKIITNPLRYKYIGCVIHRVTSLIDGGKIVCRSEMSIDDVQHKYSKMDTESAIRLETKRLSLEKWTKFFLKYTKLLYLKVDG